MFINYLKTIGITLLIIIISTFIITMLNYFNLLNEKILQIFLIVIPIISLLIGGIFIGKNTTQKGYIEGIKLGIIFSLIILLTNLLFIKSPFNFKTIILYIIIIMSSMIGSMIGINKKAKENS